MNIPSREYQVARLIAWGASDKEVAQELQIAIDTARTHRRNVEHRIGAHNTADLTRWFFQYECKVSFGLSPRQIKHIAMIMFLLVTYSELVQLPVVRVKSSRRSRTEESAVPVRCSRVKRNEYVLA